MPAIITVPYQELHDGLSESVDMTSVSVTKKYLVNWSDRWTFAQNIAGRATQVGTSSIVRSYPLQYPDNR